MCDAGGAPLGAGVSPRHAAEARSLTAVLSGVRIGGRRGPALTKPKALVADRGYDARAVRAALRARGIRAVIPERRLPDGKRRRRRGRPVHVTRERYRRRSVVEQVIGWLKESRRVATRYEKLAVNYLAIVELAILRRLLMMWLSNTA